MESMERIQGILERAGLGTTCKPMSPKEYEQFKVDDWNKTIGNRNEEDGYDCDICHNKGTVAKLVDRGNGVYSHCFADCKCVATRTSIMRMKRSGLKDVIRDYAFDKFDDAEPWQKTLKSAAMEYAKNPEGWFFVGGMSGCGKTHLCTAICREFLLEGRKVIYMLWRDEIVKIKGAANDSETYSTLIERFKTADVLYIDDLFKTGKATDNATQKPTPADVNAAFEIINYRYINKGLLTIISSECTEDELLDIDEATGGRIIEMSKSFSVAYDRGKNYRLRGAVTL